MKNILISPEEAYPLIHAGTALFIDVRDAEFYKLEHIGNAVNIPDIFYFLSKSSDEGLNELETHFQKCFSEAGAGDPLLFIFYEDSLTKRYCGACRGYWLSQFLGHGNARILYGGLDAWKANGFPVESGKSQPKPVGFTVKRNTAFLATKKDVLDAVENPDIKLLDDRDADEWNAESSSPYGKDFAPRMGRIPGAVWIEWRLFMETREGFPAFKSAEEIRALCAEQGILTDDEVIIYCFKGARASNTFVALKLAGFKHVRVYFASWNEWSRDPSLPIEQ